MTADTVNVPTIRQSDPHAFVRLHRAELLEAVKRVLDSGWYILGAEVAGFEREFGRHFGLSHTVGVANGTDAIALALRAVGIGPGARVATVSHTAVATVAAVEMAGATPVLVDIDPSSYTMDAQALSDLIGTSGPLHAVLVVHLYGQPADLPAILPLAERLGIPVIEDCAQAHGARIDGRFVGSLGDAAAFSFYPTKNLGAVGDGGLVATRHEGMAARVRMLREYGWQDRISLEAGVNSRLDELQAACLRVGLTHLEAGNRRRAEIAASYDQGLKRSGLVLPTQRPGTTHVYHQYVVRHPARDALRARLQERHIGTNVHYPMPVHLQPAYRGRCAIGPAGLDASEAAAREVLSLPMHPELDDESIARVIDAVNAAV